MYDMKPKSAKHILSYAKNRHLMGEDPMYIICGRNGPTGKTWLWNELRKDGHNVIEITEGLGGFVDYRDDENHMRDAGFSFLTNSGLVIIVLNKPLDRSWIM